MSPSGGGAEGERAAQMRLRLAPVAQFDQAGAATELAPTASTLTSALTGALGSAGGGSSPLAPVTGVLSTATSQL